MPKNISPLVRRVRGPLGQPAVQSLADRLLFRKDLQKQLQDSMNRMKTTPAKPSTKRT
jgi:hypothetical protein